MYHAAMRRPALVVAILLASGCSEASPGPGDVVKRPGNPPVIGHADDDPELAAATGRARSTLGEFISALSDPRPGQVYFSIKAPFTEGEHTEHMWLDDVRYEQGVFLGKVGNEPAFIRNPALGDEVRVAEGDISDWMIVESGRLLGGYTVRLERDRMSPQERREFDASVPFSFEG